MLVVMADKWMAPMWRPTIAGSVAANDASSPNLTDVEPAAAADYLTGRT